MPWIFSDSRELKAMSWRTVGEGKTGPTLPPLSYTSQAGRGISMLEAPRLSLVCVFLKALWAGSEWDSEGPCSPAHRQH